MRVFGGSGIDNYTNTGLLGASFGTLFRGGAGNDVVISSNEASGRFFGGADDDYIRIGGSNNILKGGDGNDTLIVESGNGNTAFGGRGNDIIQVNNVEAINDTGFPADFNSASPIIINDIYVRGQDGNDSIFVNDVVGAEIYGNRGNDFIATLNVTNAIVNGGSGDDTFRIQESRDGSDLNSTYEGKSGNDTFEIFGSGLTVRGGSGNDSFSTFSQAIRNNQIYGDGGDDSMFIANGSNNEIDGGSGSDEITLQASSSVVNNLVRGGEGDDVITLGRNATLNTVLGGNGADEIILTGNASNNTIYGDDGNDHIHGSARDEFGLTTYSGRNNRIIGGGGDDVLGGRQETYVFSEGSGRDTVNDTGGSILEFNLNNFNVVEDFQINYDSNSEILTFSQSTTASVEFKTDSTLSNFGAILIKDDVTKSSLITSSVMNQILAGMQTFGGTSAQLGLVTIPWDNGTTLTTGVNFSVDGNIVATVNGAFSVL